jgi:hypothetical protein
VTDLRDRRRYFGACVVVGDIYVTGEDDEDEVLLSSMEKYSPLSNTWSIVPSLPKPRSEHAAVAVGTAMYVLGGYALVDATILETASVRKTRHCAGHLESCCAHA